MKFLKALTQKKLAKAVVCGLVVSGGMFAGMGQADAAPAEPTAYITGATEDTDGDWAGTAGTEVKITAAGPAGEKNYSSGFVYGDYNYINGGKVTMEGGTINGTVYGGFGSNNTITIKGGTVNCVTGSTEGGNNTINISGGIVNSYVWAGEWSGNNTINISGGTIKGEVNASSYGSNNTINISGGTIEGEVFGGVEANMVNIIGIGGELNGIKNNGEISISGKIYGSIYGEGNNYLNVTGIGTKVRNIGEFTSLQFVLPAGDIAGKDMLTTEYYSDCRNVKEIKVTAAEDAKLSKGDTVNLIHNTSNRALIIWAGSNVETAIFDSDTGKVKEDYAKVIVIEKPLSATSGEVALKALDGNEENGKPNDLVFTALENIGVKDSPELADQAKSHVETRANAAALLNEGADFMLDQGIASAKAAAKESAKEGSREMAPFVAVGGGNMRYKTGSHVDSKSWHAGVGVSKQVGDMMYGIAVEHGKSNYDSYVNAVHGEGDSKATGGTVFAEMKKDSGVHYDAAIRAGRVKNDYSCAAIGSSYNESSTYYGMSIGGGKEFAVSDKDAVDVYGRYYWAHTNSSDVIIAGDRLSFDAVNSHRTRLGSRYTHTVNDISKLYAGLAWQYEFSGKAKATVNGDAAPAPSLKGNSGMLELGWKVEASKNMAIDLNMSGWTGKQRGVMGGVNMQWKF